MNISTRQTVKLQEIADVKGGKRLPKGEKLLSKSTDYPYIRVSDFRNYSVKLEDIKYLSTEIQERIKRYIITKNDVYISIAGTIGLVGTIPESLDGANLTENAARIIIKDESEIDKDYLKYYLASPAAQLNISSRKSKNAQPKLALAQIKTLDIVLPPLPEQRKIAHILSTIQQSIEQQEQIITLTAELKKALMHKLFTGGLHGKPQKQTEIGLVPESWKVVTIGEYCESSAFGPRFSSKLYSDDGNIVTLRTTDMSDDGKIDYSNAPKASLSLGKFGKHLLQFNDIVVTRSGTCGIAAVFEGYAMPVLPGAFLIRLRMKSDVFPLFLRDYINSPCGHPRILRLSQGAVQKNISGTTLRSFEIPLPSIGEQREISNYLQIIDNKIRNHTKKKQVLSDLFRTLLHQLMTAQIRVHELEFEESV